MRHTNALGWGLRDEENLADLAALNGLEHDGSWSLTGGNKMLGFLKASSRDQGPNCERKRRLESAVSLAGKAEAAWHAAWRARIECWWIGLPMLKRSQLGGCLVALTLHLGSRLDAMIGRPPQSPAVPFAAEAGCEWLAQVEALQLPEFPMVDFEFRLPPLPRLVPSWEQLLSLGAAEPSKPLGSRPLGRLAASFQSPTASTQARTHLALGGGAGVGLGAALYMLLFRLGGWRRSNVIGSKGRPALRQGNAAVCGAGIS